MSKFKVGDRVVLTKSADDNKHLKAGSRGTILEEDSFPFVQWDDFHNGHDNGYPSVPNSAWGIGEENIKLIEKPTTPKTPKTPKETKTMNTKKPGTTHGKPTAKGMKEALKPKAKPVKAAQKPKYLAPRVQIVALVPVKPLDKMTKAELIEAYGVLKEQFDNQAADHCIAGTKLDRALVDLKEAKAKIKALEAAK